ncbi:MAG: F0F1 ATP synthase subunit A [Fibrobacterales bacterium]
MKKIILFLTILFCVGNVYSAETLGDFLVHHVANSTHWSFLGLQADLSPYQISFFGLFEIQVSLHIIMMSIAFIVLLVLMRLATKRDANGVPQSRFGHSIEVIVKFIRDDVVIPNIGKKHAKAWLPFILTLFFFILALNLLGLIPGMSTATANINFTAAMAAMVFITFNLAGMKNNGPFSYVKNLVPHGVPLPVIVILFPIELIGLVTKTVALAIRLFANMSAGTP